jgi:rhodanese-related sulfurtransferase
LKEPFIHLGVIAVLCVLILGEGRRNAELQARQALSPGQLYKKLASSQVKLQLVDARPALDAYEDTHVPGALPFPGCDKSKTPPAARERIYPYVPTVVITESGDAKTFSECAANFKLALNLQGGMKAWSELNLPEDSGEYSAPSSIAGGGCL